MKVRFIALTLLFIPVTYVLGESYNYYDEIVVCYFFFLSAIKIEKFFLKNKLALGGIFSIFILGGVSNFYNPETPLISSVFIDSFTMLKPYIFFISISNLIDRSLSEKIVAFLLPICRIYIILVFFLAILSQFFSLGMSSGYRYGISAFHFIFENHSAFGITVIASMIIVVSSRLNLKEQIAYCILGISVLLLTTKGVIYLFPIFVVSMIFFLKRLKLGLRDIVLMMIFVLLASTFQINAYIRDVNSPRMVLLITANQIALENFPLGSGFSTYGGEQAKINYSSLYYKYGISETYGLSEDNGEYLNDGYVAMILAETGYFGMLAYSVLLILIFRQVNFIRTDNNKVKAFLLSAILMLMISSLATGIIKSSCGVFLVGIIALVVGRYKSNLN